MWKKKKINKIRCEFESRCLLPASVPVNIYIEPYWKHKLVLFFIGFIFITEKCDFTGTLKAPFDDH